MENASQALIIAGTILIAMIVLSLGVYLVANYSRVGESYEQTQTTTEITKFNTNFTKFIGRTDITAQEIITLKKFAENYDNENGTTTTVKYPYKETNPDKKEQAKIDAEFIKKYSTDAEGKMQYFSCQEVSIVYGDDGRVISITFGK